MGPGLMCPPDDNDHEPEHPNLSEQEDAEQRGKDEPGSVGAPRPGYEEPPEDPKWTGDPDLTRPWQNFINEQGRERRPNREDVLPYLLIRAFSPGDRAQRPLWPPVPSWLSPDILLIDAAWTGPFSADQVVASPIAGRTYRVFVHVWNLGLLPAVGVHVQAWQVNPGFFAAGGPNPAFAPQPIGGAFTDLAARTATTGAHALVEILPPWPISQGLTGHECLLAAAECPADRWGGALDANNDRHVGQRNLTILAGPQSVAPLLKLLGSQLPKEGFLEVTAENGRGFRGFGVPIEGGEHLFVATNRDGRLAVIPTVLFADLLGKRMPDLTEPGTAAKLARELGGRFREPVNRSHLAARSIRDAVGPAASSVGSAASAGSLSAAVSGSLDEAFSRMFDSGELHAGDLARVLGREGAPVLRFAVFDADGRAGGGYSIRLEADEKKPDRSR